MHNKTIKIRQFYFLLTFIFISSGCQPVHVTKQYYDNYVNPKASINYDFSSDIDLADDYLDVYFQIDSSLTKLKNELNYMESISRETMINSSALSQPWVKNVAFYDDKFTFIAGSQSLGMNESLNDFLLQDTQRAEKSFTLELHDAHFFIHTLKIGNDLFRTAVVQLDIQQLLKNIHLSEFVITIDKTIVYGPHNQDMVDAVYEKALRGKALSGTVMHEEKKRQWIRSLAADNLFYIFMD